MLRKPQSPPGPLGSHGCLGQAVIQSEGMKRNVPEEVTVTV